MKKSVFLLAMIGVAFSISASRAGAWTSEEIALFEQANANYREGRMKEAIEIYESLSEKYPRAAVFFYNLGNGHYRAGSLGASILAYERARLIEPRSGDIRRNLDFVRGLLEYRIEDKRNWYLRAAEKVLELFTEEEVGLLALTAYFLFAGSWAFVLFFRPQAPWGAARKTFLALSLLFGSLMAAKIVETKFLRDAVVTAPSADVRFGPSESDRIAFRLSEGLKVYRVDERQDWSRVLLVNGESGWVRSAQIAEIRT